MPYTPLGRFGADSELGPQQPKTISAEQIIGGLIFGEEIVLGGGDTGIIRSENYVPGVSGWAIFGSGNAELNTVTIRGDIVSSNWDGAIPANLTTRDTTATQGFYMDSSVGAAQFAGNVWFGGAENSIRLDRDGTAMITFFNADIRQGYLGFDNIGNNVLTLFNDTTNGEIHLVLEDAGGTGRARLTIDGNGDIVLLDNAGIGRLRIADNANGDISFFAAGSGVALQWDESAKVWTANDQTTGPVEIFPKGTLITMASGDAGGVALGITTTPTERGVQNVSVDHIAQPLYVEITVEVEIQNFTPGSYILLAPSVNGTSVGRTLAAGVPAATSPTGGPSTGSTDTDATSGGANHQHDSGTYATSTGLDIVGNSGFTTPSHSHSHAHSMQNHTHTVSQLGAPIAYLVTRTWRGEVTGFGGSAAMSVGFVISINTGTATINSYQVSYSVWRR